MREARFHLSTHYASSRALIVGIDKYTNASPLSYAVSDASEVRRILVDELNFPSSNITYLTDAEATKDTIMRAYLRFAADEIAIDDRVLIFYAGHGHTRTGSRGEIGYLVPFDADLSDLSTLIRWDDLTRNTELIRAKHILFIMDACYGGLALTRNLQPGSARFLKDMMLRHSRQVLTAGKADEIVADAGGPLPNHSVFTGHLIEGLRGNAATSEGVITASGLMAYVYERVANDKNSNQTPHFGYFDGDGDFIFRPPNLTTLVGDMIEGSLEDVTQSEAMARLRFLAENDPVTGALNSHGIEEAFAAAMRGLANGQPPALAYLDLDRIELINDLFGHLAGDEVLKQVCGRVREMLADGHDIGRVGRDEFVIVFRNTPIRTATAICRGIVDWIGASFYPVGDKAFQVSGSIGLIEVAAGTNVKDAMSAADRACREAKKGLHANLVVYEKNEAVFKEREEELRLIERLGTGVVPEGLFLVMQPIMSLREPYESLNFEILLRMRQADNSITSAGKIISAGENNGRSAVIDRWVMSNALEWLDQHYDELERTRFACINLSGASLNDERFIQDAFSMLAQHGRAVGKLCIEITESVALHDLANTRRFIDKVRDFGAKVALDDFGAGYTSFSNLKELRANILKIDGGFILGVNIRPADLAIVEAIVELARYLSIKSVAKSTEDLATIEALEEVGVDFVQGFVIAKPQLPENILGALSSASFIEDERTGLYVRNYLAKNQAVNLSDQLNELQPRNLTS